MGVGAADRPASILTMRGGATCYCRVHPGPAFAGRFRPKPLRTLHVIDDRLQRSRVSRQHQTKRNDVLLIFVESLE